VIKVFSSKNLRRSLEETAELVVQSQEMNLSQLPPTKILQEKINIIRMTWHNLEGNSPFRSIWADDLAVQAVVIINLLRDTVSLNDTNSEMVSTSRISHIINAIGEVFKIQPIAQQILEELCYKPSVRAVEQVVPLSQVTPETHPGTIYLTQKGRDQVRKGLRKCSNLEASFIGDPSLKPITNDEIRFLVRGFHTLSSWLNKHQQAREGWGLLKYCLYLGKYPRAADTICLRPLAAKSIVSWVLISSVLICIFVRAICK